MVPALLLEEHGRSVEQSLPHMVELSGKALQVRRYQEQQPYY